MLAFVADAAGIALPLPAGDDIVAARGERDAVDHGVVPRRVGGADLGAAAHALEVHVAAAHGDPAAHSRAVEVHIRAGSALGDEDARFLVPPGEDDAGDGDDDELAVGDLADVIDPRLVDVQAHKLAQHLHQHGAGADALALQQGNAPGNDGPVDDIVMDQRRHIGRGPGTDRFGVGEETGQVRGVLLRLQAQGTADDDHGLLPGEGAHGVKGPVGETGHQAKGIAGGNVAGVILPGGDIGEGLAALLRETEEPAHDHAGVGPGNVVVGLKKTKAHPLDHVFLSPESDGLTAPMACSI